MKVVLDSDSCIDFDISISSFHPIRRVFFTGMSNEEKGILYKRYNENLGFKDMLDITDEDLEKLL